ncbi:hypothetical protein [Streptomyces griseorubiginosus]|uniref:hypothetical protein n=1 Tax=Streptomyces griseorubiginosus TaxID=67304 RepID=UPI0033D5607D
MGFWSGQRQSWQELWLLIRARWSGRTKVGFVICVAAIVSVGYLVWPSFSRWLHEDDVAIDTYRNGQEVPRCIPTLAGTGRLGDGHHLWIAVEFLDKDHNTRILFSRRAVMSDGTWYANKIDVGGEGQLMSPYTLTAVDVDQATDRMLTSTVVDMSLSGTSSEDAGKDIWRISYAGYPSGARPVAHVQVTRLKGNDLNCNSLVEQTRKKQ